MRVRRQTLLPTVLALAFAALLATPIVALAASGLPATVTMSPESAGPGSTVEVTGIDFPASQFIELQLDTAAGSSDLAVFVSAEGGYFQEFVTLPADVPPGAWELRAIALNGSQATYGFQAVGGVVTDASAPQAITAEAGLTVSGGNSSSDIVVMLVIAVMLAAVSGGAAYAWREVHANGAQPGMGTADDPIWNAVASDGATHEQTAAADPDWMAPQRES